MATDLDKSPAQPYGLISRGPTFGWTKEFTSTTYNVKDFGAVGDGVARDTTSIRNTINAAGATGGIVTFPPGIFGLSDYLPIPYNNVYLKGSGKGATTLKLLNSVSEDIVKFFAGGFISNCGISDLTIDCGNFVVPSHGAVNLNNVLNNGFCCNVSIINMGQFGITVQGCSTFVVSGNDITLNTPINTQNNGILITAALQNINGKVIGNTCINTNIEADGRYLTINDNVVFNWMYGAGITVGPNTFTHDNNISGNVCHAGTGVDIDGTRVGGLEIWGARTSITNNKSFANSGNGIMIGGKKSTVTGNVCYDNGQTANPGDVSGIFAQFSDATENASDSIIVGNNCFNLSGTTQQYGIGSNGAVTGLLLGQNKLVGNNTAALNVVQTVATLPSASGSGAGARSFVTDATVTTFASIVAGGGATSSRYTVTGPTGGSANAKQIPFSSPYDGSGCTQPEVR